MVEEKTCIIVGDGYVGKTCLLSKIKDENFNLENVTNATIFDVVTITTVYEGQAKKINFVDTSGQEDFANIRSINYPNAEVILLCYSVNNKDSYENLENWLSEINGGKRSNAKIILIGTKSDLTPSVSYQMGESFQRQHNLERFLECSVKTNNNIYGVLNAVKQLCFATDQHVNRNISKKRCLIS